MSHSLKHSLDLFPIGCMISVDDTQGNQRIISYLNRYMHDELGIDCAAVGKPLADIFSKASRIILDTYVMPLILHEGQCVEVMLDIEQANGNKIPVSVNARLGEKREIYWTMAVADRQKQLHHKLLETRDLLENKAKLLQQQSITDDLTGLVNRRELNRQSTVIMAQSKRANWPISLLMIDVDYFKQINDSKGHDVGDEVLIQLSQLLLKQARASDIVCRFGGEEFVILMPATDSDAAQSLARRLHESVKMLKISDIDLTLSIGITTSDLSKQNLFSDLVKQADEAMYEAKGQGRNRSVVFSRS